MDVTIEHPEVLKALSRFIREVATNAPWAKPELSQEEKLQGNAEAYDKLSQELIGLGYLKRMTKSIELDGYNNIYVPAVHNWARGSLSKEGLVEICLTQTIPSMVNDLEFIRQGQFGEPKVGYVPSERIKKAREIVAFHFQDHFALDPNSKTFREDHDALARKAKQDIIDLGFESMDEFQFLDRMLP